MATAHSAGHVLDFRVEVDRLPGDVPASVQTECTGNRSGLTTQATEKLVLLVLGPTLLNIKKQGKKLIMNKFKEDNEISCQN